MNKEKLMQGNIEQVSAEKVSSSAAPMPGNQNVKTTNNFKGKNGEDMVSSEGHTVVPASHGNQKTGNSSMKKKAY